MSLHCANGCLSFAGLIPRFALSSLSELDKTSPNPDAESGLNSSRDTEPSIVVDEQEAKIVSDAYSVRVVSLFDR